MRTFCLSNNDKMQVWKNKCEQIKKDRGCRTELSNYKCCAQIRRMKHHSLRYGRNKKKMKMRQHERTANE